MKRQGFLGSVGKALAGVVVAPIVATAAPIAARAADVVGEEIPGVPSQTVGPTMKAHTIPVRAGLMSMELADGSWYDVGACTFVVGDHTHNYDDSAKGAGGPWHDGGLGAVEAGDA